MKIWLLLVLVSLPAYAKFSVSVSYAISHDTLKMVEAELAKCGKRPYMDYACAARPFKDANQHLVLVACGPNFPSKDGNGCQIMFFEKGEKGSGVFHFSITKGISLPAAQKGLALLDKQLAGAGVGYQHLNLGNPFFAEPDGVNYVCERRTEKLPWSCYLDVTER